MQHDHRSTTLRRQARIAISLAVPVFLLIPAFAGGVAAKDGGLVRVDPPIDLGTAPGTTIEVRFEPFQLIDGGEELAWSGTPFVIRLFPVDETATISRVRATERPAGSGQYSATITVPPGGLARVEIGLVGESCANGDCTISDLPFALTEGSVFRTPGAPVPSVAIPAASQPAAAVPAPGAVPATTPLPAAALVVLLVGLALGVAALAVASGRLRTVPRSRPQAPDR